MLRAEKTVVVCKSLRSVRQLQFTQGKEIRRTPTCVRLEVPSCIHVYTMHHWLNRITSSANILHLFADEISDESRCCIPTESENIVRYYCKLIYDTGWYLQHTAGRVQNKYSVTTYMISRRT